MTLLFRVNKVVGRDSRIRLLTSFLLLFAPRAGQQPAVLACLAESASLLLKAMNLKRQHVGTTLGGSHTQTHSHPFRLKHVLFFFSFFFKERGGGAGVKRKAAITAGEWASECSTDNDKINTVPARLAHSNSAQSERSTGHQTMRAGRRVFTVGGQCNLLLRKHSLYSYAGSYLCQNVPEMSNTREFLDWITIRRMSMGDLDCIIPVATRHTHSINQPNACMLYTGVCAESRVSGGQTCSSPWSTHALMGTSTGWVVIAQLLLHHHLLSLTSLFLMAPLFRQSG